MATNDAQRILVRKILADEANLEAFTALIDEVLEGADTTPVASDFFSEAAALMKRESRVKTLREIKGQFRSLHEEAKTDNYYNLNTQ